jgi:hypothetical protein
LELPGAEIGSFAEMSGRGEAEMARPFAEQAQFYRDKANEIRLMAAGVNRQPDRADIIGLAAEYDRLARRCDARALKEQMGDA